MNRFALTALVVLAGAASQSLAQFSISWFTIDGGGGTSSGGNFTLSGTIGQPDDNELTLINIKALVDAR